MGELRKLGIAVSVSSSRNILGKAGVPPAPHRDRQSSRASQGSSTVSPQLRVSTEENAELRRANVILKDAGVYFATELDPTRRR